VRRLLHPDPATGELPTLAEAARAWLALDVDGVPLPEGTDACDLAACAAVVVRLLPEAFHGVACIVQATASHGIKPGARLRLWYWCDRAITGAECKRWLKGAPVDLSIFGGVQLIYTAAPIFEGHPDPIPHRLAMLPGAPVVVAPTAAALAPQERRRLAWDGGAGTWQEGTGGGAGGRGGRFLIMAMARVANRIMEAPDGDRHATAVSQACALARLEDGGGVSAEDLRDLIAAAIVWAGKTQDEGHAIAAWAIAHTRAGVAR
jgi:hypothetical protein